MIFLQCDPAVACSRVRARNARMDPRPSELAPPPFPAVPCGNVWQQNMEEKIRQHNECVEASECPINRKFLSKSPCVNGKAAGYDCNNVDLLSFVPIAELGSTYDASDSWGWTDPQTGDEIAIIGMMDGTSFVQGDSTRPRNVKCLVALAAGWCVCGCSAVRAHCTGGGEARVGPGRRAHPNHVRVVVCLCAGPQSPTRKTPSCSPSCRRREERA